MLSKKTQDIINTIKNIYEIVEAQLDAGYKGEIADLIREAIKKTAEEDDKQYSTVADSFSRRMGITGEDSMKKVFAMIEDACKAKEYNHHCDDLLTYLLDSVNKNDDEDDVREAYINIFKIG